jgi:branched-chain amino acid aminotransferase
MATHTRFFFEVFEMMHMAAWAFINEQFIPEESASLHIRDLSIQRGYGVFDFLKFRQGQPIFMDDHLKRFDDSARYMHLPVKLSQTALKEIIKTLVQKNGQEEGGIRLTLTGGYSPDGYQLSSPNLIISQQNFSAPGSDQVRSGIQLITHPYHRQFPEAKTIDYAMAIWLQPLIRQRAADDVLYHYDGGITECPRSNFFIVTDDDKVITPKDGVLKGITRMKLLEWGAEEFEMEERPVSIEELKTIREAFITSTTKGVMPVTRIDERILPVGIITKRLREIFNSGVTPACGISEAGL